MDCGLPNSSDSSGSLGAFGSEISLVDSADAGRAIANGGTAIGGTAIGEIAIVEIAIGEIASEQLEKVEENSDQEARQEASRERGIATRTRYKLAGLQASGWRGECTRRGLGGRNLGGSRCRTSANRQAPYIWHIGPQSQLASETRMYGRRQCFSSTVGPCKVWAKWRAERCFERGRSTSQVVARKAVERQGARQ